MAVRSIIVSGGNGIGYTKEVDSSADYSSIANNTYFKDISLGVGGMILYKNGLGEILEIYASIAGKQDTLISGTTIKTINGNSLLGAGDISTEFPQSRKIFVDSTYGLDFSGRGSQVKPYLTPEFALSDNNNTGTFAGDTTNAGYTIINISSTASISIGDFIYGTGVTTYNTRVTAKTTTTITLNYPAVETNAAITFTRYTPYTLVLAGNFTATSNWYKLGMWFDCGDSYITYGAFTLFNVNTEGYVPIWINGGYWNGSTTSSKFISSLSKNIMPDIYVNIKDYKSLFTGYNIETGRSIGRRSQNNIKCPNFVCVAGYVANMSDVWNTIWDGYCYGALGGIISQAQNLVFTGLVETPSSVWSLATANCNMTVNGHIYGGLLMYSSHGTFNGDAYGVTNQLAGQTYSAPVVMNGSIKNMSGVLTIDGCHVIINGGCHQSVTHTNGSLDIMRMAGQTYTQSGNNYPHAVFHHGGGEQSSATGGEHIGLTYINLNATNGWLTVLSGHYGGQLNIASGSTFLKKGGYMGTQIVTLAGTLINHGYIRAHYKSASITGKLINKGVIETWSDKGNDGNDAYQPCLVISTGTFIQDGGQLICPIGFPGTKSGLIRKIGTGKVVFKNQPLIKVANGLAPIEILGSSANGNISNFGCITNCADGFGLLNTFSDTSYNGTHYPIVDLVGGSLYEDPTNNTFDYTNSAYLH
jgi:hypothetical protein